MTVDEHIALNAKTFPAHYSDFTDLELRLAAFWSKSNRFGCQEQDMRKVSDILTGVSLNDLEKKFKGKKIPSKTSIPNNTVLVVVQSDGSGRVPIGRIGIFKLNTGSNLSGHLYRADGGRMGILRENVFPRACRPATEGEIRQFFSSK